MNHTLLKKNCNWNTRTVFPYGVMTDLMDEYLDHIFGSLMLFWHT